jgi:DNA-directed RNA polymerase subunit N (RpoN/RPB10)
MSCGNVLADKWNAYKKELKKKKGSDELFFMDGTQIPQTLEFEIMKRLGFKRPCCRSRFLTHVDLMEKI